jgi:multidrug efflux pump subunit AcrA (membrane-fusion protein)
MNNPAISHIDHARFPLQDLAASVSLRHLTVVCGEKGFIAPLQKKTLSQFAALQQSVEELSQSMQALLQTAQEMLQSLQALLEASRVAVQGAASAVHADARIERPKRRKTSRVSGVIYEDYHGSEIILGSEANAGPG